MVRHPGRKRGQRQQRSPTSFEPAVLVPALARSSPAGVVWCTSVSGEGSQANLGPMASLSSAVGLARGGENVGGVDSAADMLTSIGMARRSELSVLMWLPPHTPDDPGNLTTQLPLLKALRSAVAIPSTLCGSVPPAPAVLFAPSMATFLALTSAEGASALELVATNVSATPGLRGEVLWSTGVLGGAAASALVVNATAGALQVQRSDGSVAWQCAGPAVRTLPVCIGGQPDCGSDGSLFLTVTDASALRLYAGRTDAPGPFVDVTKC